MWIQPLPIILWNIDPYKGCVEWLVRMSINYIFSRITQKINQQKEHAFSSLVYGKDLFLKFQNHGTLVSNMDTISLNI